MHPESTIGSLRSTLTHLHPDDGVDEKQHGNEKADIRQRLRRDTLIVWYLASAKFYSGLQMYGIDVLGTLSVVVLVSANLEFHGILKFDYT